MSMQAMNDFANAMRGDEQMAKGLAAAAGGKEAAEAKEAFVAYARDRGFEVTAQDLDALRRPVAGDGALSDEELDAVSGAGLFDFVGNIVACYVRGAEQAAAGFVKGATDGLNNGF